MRAALSETCSPFYLLNKTPQHIVKTITQIVPDIMDPLIQSLHRLMAMILMLILNICSFSRGMDVYTSPDLVPGAHATIRISGNATLNPSSVAALTEILHTLESIKELRMNDLEHLKLKQNKTDNSSVSDYISTIDHGINRMEPVRKTYGYRVTVYKQPFGADKPIVYKQDIEVDDHDVATPNIYSDDLEYAESQNNEKKTPKTKLKHFSSQRQAGRAFDKSHRSRQKTVKEHEHERHSHKKSNKFHKVTDIVENKDVKEREREAGTEHAVKEKTEIEYYEKEKFVATELPKSPNNYRIASEMDAYTPSELLGEQDSYSHAVYQTPSMTADASYMSMVPYSYYRNSATPTAIEFAKSSSPTYHYHHHYNTGGNQHNSKVRGKLPHHHYPPRHYYTTKDLNAGHIWEGFRERGYKITSQREFVVKDRIKKKEYGETEAAIKTFKTSHDYKKSEKGEREQNYYKKIKDFAAQASGYAKQQGRGHFGKMKEYLHSSANKHHHSAKTNDTNKKRGWPILEFGSRFKPLAQDKYTNGSSPRSQPSIADIIKVSIQEAVNRSRYREKDNYGSYEMAQDIKSVDGVKPVPNNTNTFRSKKPMIITREPLVRKQQYNSNVKHKQQPVLQRPRSRRVDTLLINRVKSPIEEYSGKNDYSALFKETFDLNVESSPDYLINSSLDYPTLSTTTVPPSSHPSINSQQSDSVILFQNKPIKPKLWLIPRGVKLE